MPESDTPDDIVIAIEKGGASLDDAVHDEKSQEASGINNEGYESQISYLRSNGWTWDEIRKRVGLHHHLKGD